MDTKPTTVEQILSLGLSEAVDAFARHQIQYALIGGVATGIRSRPRATVDLDFLVDAPQISLPGLLEDLRARGFVFDMGFTIKEWIHHHLIFLDYRSVRIDWLKPILPAFRHVLESSRVEQLLDRSISVASAEGLILTKLISFRPQDKVDIASLLAANRFKLDLAWVRDEWKAMGYDPTRIAALDAMLADQETERQ